MTVDTTQLTRLRTRMLATAFSNADFWTQRTAFLTDQALAALARRDPSAAEDLAARLTGTKPLHDSQVLAAAADAGIDTSNWPVRREKARAYASEAYSLGSPTDPAVDAHRVWASLYHHHPQLAQALATYLRDLPPTWQEDLFTLSHETRSARLVPAPQTLPEAAPYDPMDWEDCPACVEAEDQCRYHRGVIAGMDYQRDLITTALTDDTAIDQLQQRQSELEAKAAHAKAAQPTADDAGVPANR
ncbi:hypothetical protein ACIPSE_45500 [Streptomyces sp. NPDC090106]|uniref:hypothetical protein n=1 Tax=Streptomyces sp. NPDC090106 TaxID=3365946 RepID=UPI00380FB23A